MSNMLGFLSDIGDIIKTGIILAVVILLLVLLLKFKNGKWVLAGLMAVALVVCGVFTSFANYTYFTIEGGTFGSFGDIFANKNKITQKDLSFEFENFVLVSTGVDGEFQARLSINMVNKSLIGKSMYVNQTPTKLTGVGENYIFAEYSYIFKDENLMPMFSDTLTIKFVFNSKKSECLLSTSGGSDAVKFWNSYLKKNKFNVEIKKSDYDKNKEIYVENITNFGLFETGTNTLIKTWSDLLNDGDIAIQEGNNAGNLKCFNTSLSGDLIVPNISNVTSLNRSFKGCSGLTSIDLSHLNKNNISSVWCPFDDCSSLTSLDLSNWIINFNLSDMSFARNLQTLNLSNWDVTNVTDMSSLFAGYTCLKSINLSSFNTTNVTNMSKMFYNCSSLTNLDLSNFNTSNVIDMSEMFYECSGLQKLNLSNWDVTNVTNMSKMFGKCSSLTNLDLSSFNTIKVENMSYMFLWSPNLETLNLSNFNTNNVVKFTSMFDGCDNLRKENIIISDTYTLNNLDDLPR